MPRFSSRSADHLYTACEPLREIFEAVIETYDCTVLQGHRPEQEQDEYYRTGKSKVIWPNSKHNVVPALAVDVAPYPIDWGDRERFVAFGSFTRGVAWSLGHIVRWGGDWDGDFDLRDQSFMDLVHFEYVEKR